MEKGNVNDKETPKNNSSDLEATVKALMAKVAEMEKNQKQQQTPQATTGFDASQMLEFAKTLKKSDIDYNNYVDQHDIDPGDYDEGGVLFTAPSTGLCIVDDLRRGVKVQTPNKNIIFFMFEGQVQSRDDRGKAVINTFSCYLSRSKKEQEWLRAHTTYGIKFSESGKKALSTDTIKMQKLQAYMLGVQNLDNQALFARCKQAGLPVSNDVVSMRFALAEKQLADHEASTESASHRMVRERMEEEEFLSDTSKFTRK